MNRRLAFVLSVLIALSSIPVGPATPANAGHISCSLIHFPLGHPGMGTPPYSYGASGYGQISCNGATTLVIWVELAINGNFSAPVRTASNNCAAAVECAVETTIACCYLASDYAHTRAAGAYLHHGTWVDVPWTAWKCYLLDPGMRPSGATPGALVAAAIAEPGASAATACSAFKKPVST